MITVSPAEVAALFPAAPAVGEAHINLATLWASGELAARRVVVGTLTPEQVRAAQMAIAAKALALATGIGGAVSLTTSVAGGGLKAIRLPGLELTLNAASVDTEGKARIAATELDALALQLLMLALPVRVSPPLFFGASR